MRHGILRYLASWSRAEKGSVAVEFALASLPFFMLVVGLLEISVMYASATILEGATVSAARVIRTGQAQQSSDAVATFKTALCDIASALIPCESIVFEAIHPPGNTFGGADGIPPQYDAHGNLISQGFDPGGINDVIMVRTSYRYHFITPFLASTFANNTDNSVLLQSTVTIKNEPYVFEN